MNEQLEEAKRLIEEAMQCGDHEQAKKLISIAIYWLERC